MDGDLTWVEHVQHHRGNRRRPVRAAVGATVRVKATARAGVQVRVRVRVSVRFRSLLRMALVSGFELLT